MNTPSKFFAKINCRFIALWFAVAVGFSLPVSTVSAQIDFNGQIEKPDAKAKVKAPKLTIKSPGNKSTFTTNAVLVTGITTAKGDSSAVTAVNYMLNGTGPFLASTANGWSNWWADVTLVPGVNALQFFATDASANNSKTENLTLNFNAVPGSLSGQTMVVSFGGATEFTMTFTNGSFSQNAADPNFVDGVGTYTFQKINSMTAKLTVAYTAPPNATGDGNLTYLRFTDGNSGVITNGNKTLSTFVLSPALDTAPTALGGNFSLTSTNDPTLARSLIFTLEPTITGSGPVVNPLVLAVSAPYLGNIGDRVNVQFFRFKSTSAATNIYTGTVVGIVTNSTPTNTVTVLFDSSGFVSHNGENLFAPIVGSLLQVATFNYTNFVSGSVDSSGTGTSAFVTYSPAGVLLTLIQANETSAYVLTFDTNGGGTYYEEFNNPPGGSSATDAGTFAVIAPPQITSQPGDAIVTNGATATFNVSALGTPPLDYQWLKDGADLMDIGNISGSATPSLSVAVVTPADEGAYQVIVTNFYGSITSSVANLIISSNSVPGP
jgi:hypothetical protein